MTSNVRMVAIACLAALQGACTSPDSSESAKAAYLKGDHEAAFREFKALAEKDDHVAQYAVGFMLEEGQGTPKNEIEAMRWIRMAAEGGVAPAQNHLGVRYATGTGVPKDDREALRLFKLAADQGEPAATFSVGHFETDSAEAFKWYLKAAELGMDKAAFNVGLMYVKGRGVQKDEKRAFEWFGKAAEQGNVDSIYFVGSMQIEGHGTAVNKVAAYQFLQLAADRGHERAKQELALLRFKLTPDEIAKAKDLAAGWKPKEARKPRPW